MDINLKQEHFSKEYYLRYLADFSAGEEVMEGKAKYVIAHFPSFFNSYREDLFYSEIIDMFFTFCVRQSDPDVNIEILKLIEQ
jgi:hypothetical protein